MVNFNSTQRYNSMYSNSGKAEGSNRGEDSYGGLPPGYYYQDEEEEDSGSYQGEGASPDELAPFLDGATPPAVQYIDPHSANAEKRTLGTFNLSSFKESLGDPLLADKIFEVLESHAVLSGPSILRIPSLGDLQGYLEVSIKQARRGYKAPEIPKDGVISPHRFNWNDPEPELDEDVPETNANMDPASDSDTPFVSDLTKSVFCRLLHVKTMLENGIIGFVDIRGFGDTFSELNAAQILERLQSKDIIRRDFAILEIPSLSQMQEWFGEESALKIRDYLYQRRGHIIAPIFPETDSFKDILKSVSAFFGKK